MQNRYLHPHKNENDKRTHFHLENIDEKAIWDDFLKGNDTALSYIYRNYAQKLFNYGSQFTKSEIVLDCIQDLFYDLIKTRAKLSSCNSMAAYLYSSLRRKIFRSIKKLDKEVRSCSLNNEDAFRIDLDSDNNTADDVISEKLKIIEGACNMLPPRQREIILLYYYEQLSYKEIMDVMKIAKISSARILVHRALQSLRELLTRKKTELLILLALFID
jgi:RNA polymerase sigma factor (sigma-70 family)